MIRTGQFRYARWDALEPLLKAGWMVVGDLGPVHGFWSVLLWKCDCEVPE